MDDARMTRSTSISPPADPSRRRLIGGSILGLAGLALACSRSAPASGQGLAAKPGLAKATQPKVTVVEFRNDATRVQALQLPKVVHSDAEWHALLSPRSYQVARRGGTETPFSGEYNALHDVRGVFRCICCGTALFDARTKFDSGTGWPSFWQPIAAENVHDLVDRSFGWVRTETRCTRCDAHLGHVFEDGPKPTGLRYCMNSVALKYFPA
jgi:peptide-methionine (R)-S-oxide reductase